MSIHCRAALIAAVLVLACALPAAAQSTVGFGDGSYSFPENAYPMPVKFTRTGSTAGAVTITYSVLYGSSLIRSGIPFTMDAGLSTAFRDISSDWYWDDGYDFDYTRNFTLKIDKVDGGASIGLASVPLAITPVSSPVTVEIDDVTVDEGMGKATFTLRMNGNRTDPGFNVQVITHDGTAHLGSDFRAPVSPVFWYSNQRSIQIDVPLVVDSTPEGDETFTVEVQSNFVNWSVKPLKLIGTCTIHDDDDAIGPKVIKLQKKNKGQINVQFTDPAATAEQVTFSAANPAIVSVPGAVTIPAGASAATVDVLPLSVGSTTIIATSPASRGGRQFVLQVSVYEPEFLTFEKSGVSVDLGATTTVKAAMDPPPAAPVDVAIMNLSPSIATIPSTLTIGTDGTGLLSVKGVAAGAAQVVATLPETFGGAQTPLRVDVVVPSGLAITSLSKSSGRASGNERVKVFGNNVSGRCIVTFGGVPSPDAQPASGGAIDAATPPHDAGVVDVTLKCGSDSFTYKNSFTFTPSALSFAQITPATGTTNGGTVVRLTGENLRTSGCEAWFGNAPARTIATTQTTDLLVAAPAHDAGSVAVSLRCGSQTAMLSSAFNYFAADDPMATITAFTPATAKPGDRVTIDGSRFRRDDVILIGGVAAFDLATPALDKHTITIPELAAGTAAVSLRDSAGRTISGPSLTIAPPTTPSITRIPATVAAGAELAISGAALRRGLTYTIGSAVLTPIAMTSSDATFRVPPALAAGATQFVISNGATSLFKSNMTVTANGLSVAGINPPCSSELGGALVTITGAGFESGAVAQFGSAYSADAIVRDANTIIARVPPSFGALQPVITIYNRSGSSTTLSSAFTYMSNYEGCGGRSRGTRH